MARIHEEIITVKLSKLLKDTGNANCEIDPGLMPQIEALVQELVSDASFVVEVAYAGPNVNVNTPTARKTKD